MKEIIGNVIPIRTDWWLRTALGAFPGRHGRIAKRPKGQGAGVRLRFDEDSIWARFSKKWKLDRKNGLEEEVDGDVSIKRNVEGTD